MTVNENDGKVLMNLIIIEKNSFYISTPDVQFFVYRLSHLLQKEFGKVRRKEKDSHRFATGVMKCRQIGFNSSSKFHDGGKWRLKGNGESTSENTRKSRKHLCSKENVSTESQNKIVDARKRDSYVRGGTRVCADGRKRVRGALSRHRVSRQTAWQLLDLFIRLAYLATYERASANRSLRARINTLSALSQLLLVFMDVRATFRFGQLTRITIYVIPNDTPTFR